MLVIFLVCATIACGAAGQIMLKNGMNAVGKIEKAESLVSAETISKMASNIFVVLGLLLYALSAIFWLGAISSLEISLAYPLMSLSYVLVAVLAFFIFKENISVLRWAGIAVIILGCVMLAKSA